MSNTKSDFRLGHLTPRKGETKTGVSGGSTSISLPRTYITPEHRLLISASQAGFTANPTAADVRKAIASATLSLSGGNQPGVRWSLSGDALDAVMRFGEEQAQPNIVLGATSTAFWALDLHHEIDGAYQDMLTAIKTGDYSSIDLEINWAAAGALFAGGTGGGAVNFSVETRQLAYIVPNVLDPNFKQVGTWVKKVAESPVTLAASGDQQDFKMKIGNKTGRIFILAYDNTGALSDAVLDRVKYDIAGFSADRTFAEIRQENIQNRNFNHVGIACLEFGDDAAGFLPTDIDPRTGQKVSEAALSWSTLVAAGSVKFVQEYYQPNV